MTYGYHTKNQEKLQVIAKSSANALNFYCISLNYYQKRENIKKKQEAQKEVTCTKPMSQNQGLRPNLIAVSAFSRNVVLTVSL